MRHTNDAAIRQPESLAGEQTWHAFAEVLQAEHVALTANDAERIAALAEQKLQLATQLAGLPRASSPQAAILIASAKALNQANLALLQQRSVQNRQALALLRPTTADCAAYGPDGRVHRTAYSQRVGEA